MGHGAQKLFGWFGGHGFAGTTGWLESMGYRPGSFWATMVGIAEFGGGLLFGLGLLTPLGAAMIFASMLTATFKVHWPKFWVAEGGFEYPLAIMATCIGITMTGPGGYSIDQRQGFSIPSADSVVPWLFGLVVLAVFVGLGSSMAERPVRQQEIPAETIQAERQEEIRGAA
jgi:putative oxidoreductase